LWPEVCLATGVHPHEARQVASRLRDLPEELERAWRATPDLCAIGEIGLDYHYDLSPRDAQREVFAIQVRFARQSGHPVIVHTREADEDTLAIIDSEGGGEVRGVFHCFSGTPELARAAIARGFHLSFSGILTFPRAETLRLIASEMPDDRLLVETDCPYLAPVPRRGRRNEPAWIVHTGEVLARARGVSPTQVATVTTANFQRLFGR